MCAISYLTGPRVEAAVAAQLTHKPYSFLFLLALENADLPTIFPHGGKTKWRLLHIKRYGKYLSGISFLISLKFNLSKPDIFIIQNVNCECKYTSCCHPCHISQHPTFFLYNSYILLPLITWENTKCQAIDLINSFNRMLIHLLYQGWCLPYNWYVNFFESFESQLKLVSPV